MRRALNRIGFLAVVVTFTIVAAASAGAEADGGRVSAAAPPGPDTDRDGLSDKAETSRYHTDPRKRDTDRDGLNDGDEVRKYHTNPRKADTDRDDLSDRAEIRRYHTDPRKSDTDRDGLSDGEEVRRYHTDPLQRDTDGDGYADGAEIRKATDPRSRRSRPGYPGEDTTGVPAGIALTPYTGPSTISTPNTVISGKSMGCIQVTAPGVVIRNSKISCGDAYAVASFDGSYTGTPLRLEDTEIDCANTPGTAISEANVIATRLNIHSCENGFNISQGVTVEDSYIHDLYNSAESHSDGIQFATGHIVGGQIVPGVVNVIIRHNTIYGMGADGSFATSAIIDHSMAVNTNVLIENNLLAGGAYTLYCSIGFKGVDYRVVENRFSRKFSTKVGFYGPASDCGDEVQSGNVYHETGRPLTLG